MALKIRIQEWRKLAPEDRKEFEYISNEKGCYYQLRERKVARPQEVDEYDILVNNKKEERGNSNG